jgi:hypothetical protein
VFQAALSVAALVGAAITFGIGYRANRAAERRSYLPVLVFVYDAEEQWVLRNVGNGPALNVVVASKINHDDPEWTMPTRVPPLPRDGEFRLAWLAPLDPAVLVATYEDFLAIETTRAGRYTVTVSYDVNRVVRGSALPNWTVSETLAHWQREQRDPTVGLPSTGSSPGALETRATTAAEPSSS